MKHPYRSLLVAQSVVWVVYLFSRLAPAATAEQADPFFWGTDGLENYCSADCQFPGVPDEPLACVPFIPICCAD